MKGLGAPVAVALILAGVLAGVGVASREREAEPVRDTGSSWHRDATPEERLSKILDEAEELDRYRSARGDLIKGR